MFIEYLEKEEQEVFLSLAMDLVKIDEDYTEDEKSKINSLSHRIMGEVGFDMEHLKSDINLLENNGKRKIVLMELVTLAHIDGNYCDGEKGFISDLAKRMEIGQSDLDEVEQWVSGFVAHIQKGADFINRK